jgi:hypothetical protein
MLARRTALVLLALPVFSVARIGRADDVRYYEENGITYRETTRTVQRPILETHYEDKQQTVYTSQPNTQMQSVQRTVQVPVSQYVAVPYWVNRYNPFATPYQAVRYELQTHWETRVENVQVPVTQYNSVPQTQTVKVPVTTQRMASEQQISRVAVSARPATGSDPFANGNNAVASRPASPAPFAPGAGSTPLDSDPPRGPTAWRPADPSAVSK